MGSQRAGHNVVTEQQQFVCPRWGNSKSKWSIGLIASKESRFQKPGAQSLLFLPVSPCSLWFLNPSQRGTWSFFSLEGYTQEQGMNSLKTGLLNLGLVLPSGCLWLCPHVVLEARPCQVTAQSSRETQGPDDHEDSLWLTYRRIYHPGNPILRDLESREIERYRQISFMGLRGLQNLLILRRVTIS